MAREINLVPDIKYDAIRAIKVRNWTFFVCFVVAAICVGVLAVLGTVLGGQTIAMNNADSSLEKMSSKLTSYEDLGDYLTIQNQLTGLNSIAENKREISRLFGILSVMQPTNGDEVTFSELTISFEDDAASITFEAQADALTQPYIDYNVLDAFKKNLDYIKYDYGRYVDKNGEEIPAYCIVETGDDGATLAENGNVFAYWKINEEGCNPSEPEEEDDDEEESESSSLGLGDLLNNNDEEENDDDEEESEEDEHANEDPDYDYFDYGDGERVVRIWRSVQYDDWYQKGYLSLDGAISGVAHFESQCYSRSGAEEENKITWSETNMECMIVPDGQDGISITESSNGKDSDDNLVLRFAATINLDPEVFSFQNKHVLMVGPTGSINVTDSYTQVQNMFGERASDCDTGDTSCYTTTTGVGTSDSEEENNSDSSNGSSSSSSSSSRSSNRTNSTSGGNE